MDNQAMWRLIMIFATLLLASGSYAAEEVFSTIGSDGERVYSDKPMPDAEIIQLGTSAAPENEPTEEPQAAFEDLSPCEQARFIVARYEASEQLAERTDDGGVRVLSDEERLAMIAKAREDEQRLCGEDDEA